MAFADRLLRRRRPLDEIVGFSGGTLGEQLDDDPIVDRTRPRTVTANPQSDYADPTYNDATGQWENLPNDATRPRQVSPFAQRLLQDRSGIVMGTGANAGRGYEFLPRDPNYPNETAEQTKRRLEMQETFKLGRTPDDFRDPTASQFPVNALGTPMNEGYGAGYNKGPLDRGYVSPARSNVPPNLNTDETRPRQVNPFEERFMRSRERIADPTRFDAEHLRELEAKKDPRWERILNAGLAGVVSATQGGAPIKAIPTRRERDIATIENRLGRDVALDNARIKRHQDELRQQQNEMVDVDVPDGQGGTVTVQVPRSKEATVRQANRKIDQAQQRIDQANTVLRKDAQGRIVRITRQPDGTDKTEVVVNVIKTPIPHTVWADGKLRIWNPETSRYDTAKDTNNNEITDELKTAVTVDINGKRFRVSPNTAATSTALSERFNITEDRAERAEGRAEERDYRGRLAKAADLVGKIDGAKEAMRAAKAKLDKRPNDTDARQEFEEAKAYAVQAAKELGEGYSDLYEVGVGTDEFKTPYYKRKDTQPPSAPITRRPQPSAPNSGGGGKKQRVTMQQLKSRLGLP